MKVSMAALSFVTLTAVLGTQTQIIHGGPYHPAECCFHYITHAIPHQRVTRYYETTSECSRPGVIFITKRNQPICANPENEWVQDLIKELGEN
ncbi:C-C motif chemokine 14-like isoform X2 [Perognathus longimembris pacificus]|uniref:C-C motif chemokine 14-like isoform X2 n=1 Tax=Perognathus longimembris pacificus TaxID=214514 RepID=UPI002018E6F0|nr:C-C motif chemokine 14-like isoform X2 [Perognathus longimembris pacificus]